MQVENRWYRQPAAWLGVAIFAASLAGCIGMIVVSLQYPEDAGAVQGEQILKAPIARQRLQPADRDSSR